MKLSHKIDLKICSLVHLLLKCTIYGKVGMRFNEVPFSEEKHIKNHLRSKLK